MSASAVQSSSYPPLHRHSSFQGYWHSLIFSPVHVFPFLSQSPFEFRWLLLDILFADFCGAQAFVLRLCLPLTALCWPYLPLPLCPFLQALPLRLLTLPTPWATSSSPRTSVAISVMLIPNLHLQSAFCPELQVCICNDLSAIPFGYLKLKSFHFLETCFSSGFPILMNGTPHPFS